MVLQNVTECEQLLLGHHTKVILSKEAQAAVAVKQDKRSETFRDALHTTWKQLNELTMKMISMHHKSVKHVQHDLFLGHGVLSTW